MLKRSLAYILLLMALFYVLGCTEKQSSNMTELEYIDSLLFENNSVRAIEAIHAIDPDVLNEEERALYSLLLTQAQYKNLDPITSDSVINQAVAYYHGSADKEKATRSILYQGCVYEVLGNLEKAIACYNQVEETAGDKDLFNKSYASLRLGFLYQSQAIGSCIIAAEKFKEALHGFRKINEKHYELVSLSELGSIYREFKDKNRQDSAVIYLTEAYHLSDSLNDLYYKFSNLFIRAEYYDLFRKDYHKAKDDILKALSVDSTIIDHPRAHFCAASIYLHLGQKDSALYYIQRAPQIESSADSVRYYDLLADIALVDGDQKSWLVYHNRAHSMADSILVGSLNAKLLAVEKKYDLQQEELKNVTLQNRLKSAWLTVALALLAAITLLHFLWRYRNRLRAKENEYELLKSDLDSSLSSLEQMHATINDYKGELREAEDAYKADLARQEALVTNLDREIAGARTVIESQEQERRQLNDQIAALEAKKAQSDEIRAVLDGQIQVVQELIRCSHELDNERFARKFASLMSVPDDPRTATYWSNLHVLTNDLYNNILDDAMQLSGGRLLKSDLNFIALLCCGCSRTAIMIIMKFSNLVSISNKKNKIARKMGIVSLDAFIVSYRERPRKTFA